MKEMTNFIEKYLSTVSKSLGIKPTIDITPAKVQDNEILTVAIRGDNLSFLIGYRGTSLDGLQHLLSLAVYKEFNEWPLLVVDVNDYRSKKKESLEELARSFIDRVRFFNEEVEMLPMSSFDRKQIHEFIAGYDDVTSFSVGEGADRRVVIKPAL